MTAPQHGGGGGALLLLAFRQGLEQLTKTLRAGNTELLAGAAILPAELAAASQQVRAAARFALAAKLATAGLMVAS